MHWICHWEFQILEKQKFLLNSHAKKDSSRELEWWRKSRSLSVMHWIRIREGGCRGLYSLFESHKMNHSNQSEDNDKKVVCWSTYHKQNYAVNSERILAWQKRWRTENSEVLKACWKDGVKTTRNRSSGTREHILHGTRNTSAVTNRNMAKTTRNG